MFPPAAQQTSDFTLNLGSGGKPVFHGEAMEEDWEASVVQTGLLSGSEARIRRVAHQAR